MTTQKPPAMQAGDVFARLFEYVPESLSGHRLARQAARTNDLNVLYGLMAITDDLWSATQHDEAPEFETEVRVVRSA